MIQLPKTVYKMYNSHVSLNNFLLINILYNITEFISIKMVIKGNYNFSMTWTNP